MEPTCLFCHRRCFATGTISNCPTPRAGLFWLNGSALQYPDFENAETFVKRLIDRGLIAVDPVIANVVDGHAQALSDRTAQRRFMRVMGMARATIDRIERARRATALLRDGVSILDAVEAAGYYDQAHLTRSLKHFVGQTPGQILRGEQQLSFLYNTDPP